MNFFNVLNGVLSLSMIIIIGYIARKKDIINLEITSGLSKLLLNITLPLLIINSFNIEFTNDMKSNVYRCFILSFLIMILSIIIAKIFLLPIKDNKKVILEFGTVFSNCGFMAFPIIMNLFGNEGVLYTSIFNMFFTIFLWTYGVILFSNKKDSLSFKKLFVNPSIIAVFIGIFIMIFSINLPTVITNTLSTVGSMTTPLSMIIIGSILASTQIRNLIKDWHIYYGSLLKLIILPLLIAFISKLFLPVNTLLLTLVVLVAMPSATMTSIFAENFNKNKEFASVFVFITTLLSILTIPFIISIINTLKLL